jgi:FKBP-type peptidyl-prolyl cis-trans isomerase FkpA
LYVAYECYYLQPYEYSTAAGWGMQCASSPRQPTAGCPCILAPTTDIRMLGWSARVVTAALCLVARTAAECDSCASLAELGQCAQDVNTACCEGTDDPDCLDGSSIGGKSSIPCSKACSEVLLPMENTCRGFFLDNYGLSPLAAMLSSRAIGCRAANPPDPVPTIDPEHTSELLDYGGSATVVSGPRRCAGDDKVELGDFLSVRYKGSIDNSSAVGVKGFVFDQTSPSDPLDQFQFTIGFGQVIEGWEKGLMGLCRGDHVILILPPLLGYGSRGDGASVPGNATLRFDVEIVDCFHDDSPPPCGANSDCAAGEYCDDTQTCTACDTLETDPSLGTFKPCDVWAGDCCSADFLEQCPSNPVGCQDAGGGDDASSCLEPPPDQHGIWSGGTGSDGDFLAGETATLVCDPGYTATPLPATMLCETGGLWTYDGEFARCTEASTPSPEPSPPPSPQPEPVPEPGHAGGGGGGCADPAAAACQNDATCEEDASAGDGYRCVCPTSLFNTPLYFGHHCESSENDCHLEDPSLNPCLDAGVIHSPSAASVCVDCSRLEADGQPNLLCGNGYICSNAAAPQPQPEPLPEPQPTGAVLFACKTFLGHQSCQEEPGGTFTSLGECQTSGCGALAPQPEPEPEPEPMGPPCDTLAQFGALSGAMTTACCPTPSVCNPLPASCAGECQRTFLDFYTGCRARNAQADPTSQRQMQTFYARCSAPGLR